jgi:hypothetical protein
VCKLTYYKVKDINSNTPNQRNVRIDRVKSTSSAQSFSTRASSSRETVSEMNSKHTNQYKLASETMSGPMSETEGSDRVTSECETNATKTPNWASKDRERLDIESFKRIHISAREQTPSLDLHPAADAPNISGSLSDYIMQLTLIEQQNKKFLMLARLEQQMKEQGESPYPSLLK